MKRSRRRTARSRAKVYRSIEPIYAALQTMTPFRRAIVEAALVEIASALVSLQQLAMVERSARISRGAQ